MERVASGAEVPLSQLRMQPHQQQALFGAVDMDRSSYPSLSSPPPSPPPLSPPPSPQPLVLVAPGPSSLWQRVCGLLSLGGAGRKRWLCSRSSCSTCGGPPPPRRTDSYQEVVGSYKAPCWEQRDAAAVGPGAAGWRQDAVALFQQGSPRDHHQPMPTFQDVAPLFPNTAGIFVINYGEDNLVYSPSKNQVQSPAWSNASERDSSETRSPFVMSSREWHDFVTTLHEDVIRATHRPPAGKCCA